jgi:integrase/recombinase XerD
VLNNALEIIVPEADWSWFEPIIAHIASHVARVPRAHKPIIEVHRLIALGGELMQRAEDDWELPDVQRAEIFRNGLMIAFLALRPLRRENMVTLVLGESIRETGSGFSVLIEARHAKARLPIDFALPDVLVPAMQRYLTLYRPILAAGAGSQVLHSSHLWLARTGRMLPSDTFADMISRQTTRAFGQRLTPHDFRHAAATAIATHSPEEFGIIRSILGHSSTGTAENYYIHAKGTAAANAYQAVVRNRRQEKG